MFRQSAKSIIANSGGGYDLTMGSTRAKTHNVVCLSERGHLSREHIIFVAHTMYSRAARFTIVCTVGGDDIAHGHLDDFKSWRITLVYTAR